MKKSAPKEGKARKKRARKDADKEFGELFRKAA